MSVIDRLRLKYDNAVGRILEACPSVTPGRLPRFQFAPAHDGSAHVEVVGGTFHYVVTERGTEYERKLTLDENELMYWLVKHAAHCAASEWELRHRVAGQDSRRLLFAKQVELLGLLSDEWATRARAQQDLILARNPYNDGL